MPHLNKDIVVTKKFLPENIFKNIKQLVSSPDFGWFYQKEQNPYAKDGFFFSHKLYDKDDIISNHYNNIIFNIFRKKLNYQTLVRAQINLITRSDKARRSIFHRDFENKIMTTGIFYINENNGYTEFESGEKIKSISNMFVEFPINLKYRAVSQTDADIRVVLNLNYYK